MSVPHQYNVLWSSPNGLQPVQIMGSGLYLVTNMKPNLEDCCRFCARNKNDLLILELNSSVYTEYLEMLTFLKIDYIDLSSHNKLSRKVCKTCSKSLRNAYSFFKQVKRAQKTLNSYYENSFQDNVVKETLDYTKNIVTHVTNKVSELNIPNQVPQCNKLFVDDAHIKEETPDPEVNNHMSVSPYIETDFPLIYTSVHANVEDNNVSIKKEASKTPSPEPQSDLNVYQSNSPASVTSRETTFPITNTALEPEILIKIKEYECVTEEQMKNYGKDKVKKETQSPEPQSDLNIYQSNSPVSVTSAKTFPIKNTASEPKTDIKINELECDTEEQTKDKEKESEEDIESEVDESWDSYEWFCFYCNTKFETMNDLRTHSKDTHAKCYGFKCVDCRDDFNTFSSFIEHVRRHKQYLRFFCEYCNKEFDSPLLCTSHTLTHWSGSQRACEHCGEQLADQEALERHKRAYKKKGIAKHSTRKGIVMVPGFVDVDEDDLKSWSDYDWTCRDCGARLPDVASLRLHSQKVHKKCFAMKCVDCLLVKRCFKSFVAHVRRHRPVFNTICEYCNVHCSDMNEYKNHIQTHDTPVPPCGGCGQIFPTRAELLDHIITYNACIKTSTLTTDDLTCVHCQKYCKSMSILKCHMRIHSKNREKEFICHICGASFYSNSSFKDHKATHGLKSFECSVCKGTFKSNRHLAQHIRTHNEDTPFICDYCGKSFKNKFRIKSHLIVHSDTMPFKCLVCGKGFRFKNCLKAHMTQHTGFKNFACEYCDVKFYNWSNCNKHMIRRHGVTLARTKRTPTGNVAITDRRVPKPAKSDRKKKKTDK